MPKLINIQTKQQGQVVDASEFNQLVEAINIIYGLATSPSHVLSPAQFIEDGETTEDGEVYPIIKIRDEVLGQGGNGEVTSPETGQTILQKLIDVGALIPESLLPGAEFSYFEGSGTPLDPYIFDMELFMKQLPGWGEGKVLTSDFTWQEMSANESLPILAAPDATMAAPAMDAVTFSWPAVFGATTHQWQRDTTIQFLNPVNVYNSTALTFTDSGLTPSTNYQYRFRILGSGYQSSPWVLYSATTAAAGNTTPLAPTNGVVNDTADTFGFTLTPGIALAGNYEQSLDGGNTITTVTANPIVVGNVAKAAGQVMVRVKAATGRNASAWLSNLTAFTVATTTPPTPIQPITDDVGKTFDWTEVAGFPNLADYEATKDGGTTQLPVGAKPFYVGEEYYAAGKVGIRIKAATGRNAGQWLFNTVAFAGPAVAIEKEIRLNLLGEYTPANGNTNGFVDWRYGATVASTPPTAVLNNILDKDGVASGISAEVTGRFTGASSDVVASGTQHFIFNNEILNASWHTEGASAGIKFKGLTAGKFYQFAVLGENGENPTSGLSVTIGGVNKNRSVYNNLPAAGVDPFVDPALIVFKNIQADGAGEVAVSFAPNAGFYKGFLTAIIIRQTNTIIA